MWDAPRRDRGVSTVQKDTKNRSPGAVRSGPSGQKKFQVILVVSGDLFNSAYKAARISNRTYFIIKTDHESFQVFRKSVHAVGCYSLGDVDWDIL